MFLYIFYLYALVKGDHEVDDEEFFTVDFLYSYMFSHSEGIILDLPDEALSSDTTGHDGHPPSYGRIGGDEPKGWAGTRDVENIFTVDLISSHIVTGVATQGRSSDDHIDQWVTSYSVETSVNGYDWTSHGNFVGNFDKYTVVERSFEVPVRAAFVRFKDLGYNGHPVMRVDVLVYECDIEHFEELLSIL